MTHTDTKNTMFDTKQHNTDTTKTHEKPPNKKRRPHINFHHFASKKCQTPPPPKNYYFILTVHKRVLMYKYVQ